MTFHEKLARLCRDLNKAKVCRRAGLPPGSISDYINKSYAPRSTTAAKLAKALGVSLDWFLDDTKAWPPVRIEESEVCSAA